MLDAEDRAPLSVAIGWGSGSFCQSLVIYAYSVLVLRYLTDTVGIAAALAGTLMAVSKTYDALINPLIGWFTDRIDTPMGRRRPWMLLGGIFSSASLVLGFHIPLDAAMGVKIAWACAGQFLFSTGFSLFAIPWLAMPQEISGSGRQRTQMMAWRVGFSSLAQGAASLSGPMLLAALGMGAVAYGVMGWVMGALCLGGAAATVFFTRHAHNRLVESTARQALGAQFGLLFANRPFLVLVGIKVCLYFGLAVSASGMALLTRWVFGVSDYWLGVYTMVSTLALLASQPGWLWLSGRLTTRGALGCAFALHGLSQLSLFFNSGSVTQLMGQALLLGAGGGGVFMLSQALLPDVIEHDYRNTGLRRGGAFAGVVSLLETGASAFALFALGLALSAGGYVAGTAEHAGQPPQAIEAIRWCACLLPAAAELLGILLLTRFRLDPTVKAAVV
jgi:GPH family glycoside/pentoside/hexuronide:cation symporter